MSLLNSILITALLAGNLFAAAYDNSESEANRSSSGDPVLSPSVPKRNSSTAEDVQNNSQTHLPKELELAGQGIKANNISDEAEAESINGVSASLASDMNKDFNQTFYTQVCIKGDSVQRLDILDTPENLTSGCKQVFTVWSSYDLSRMGVSKFETGWYRLKNNDKVSPNLTAITLRDNNIVQITSNIMSELSEYITWMDLQNNKIERLHEGCFENGRIFSLDLSNNSISEIEQNAFKMPALYQLFLDDNRLKDTKFAATLPLSLSSLYLHHNEISELSANSFSKLTNLSYLNLNNNKLTMLPNQCLLGATSIYQLSFSDNQITTIESGAFEGLHPFQIFLDGNNISRIENGTFTAVTGLRQLNIERNKLTKIEPGMFDQPNLKMLQLAGNNIISFENGALEKLSQLETLDISKNPVIRLDDAALIGLNKKVQILFG